jgi:3',5'-cyclic AMP phosphodiesterase CpdA
MLSITRPNLGQPIITTLSELASGISFIISSEPNDNNSDIKDLPNYNLSIRPVDQKDIKFPLEVVNVQVAKVNYQRDVSFNHVETHLVIHKILELGKKEIPFWEVTVCIREGIVLSGRRKRLFDIILTHGSETRKNNHALCVYESIGNNLNFIHSTDLHLARRNDKVLGIIKDKAPRSAYEDAEKSFINFNQNFRHLIRHVNNHSDEIDFLIVSGDLVDYYQPDELYKPDPLDMSVCPFEESNLSIFCDSVLGGGLNQNNELAIPIFTTTGNHDFRPYHYNLSQEGLFKSFGLKEEYVHYLDETKVLHLDPILTANIKWLKEYFRHVNPDLDYLVRFGSTDLLFLDGGKDNYSFFSHLWDAIGGSPDTDCTTDLQMEIINSYFEQKKNVGPIFVVIHTPPVNIRGKYVKEELYEDFRKEKTGNGWIDYRDRDLSYGSLAYNWEKFLEVLTGLTNEKGYKVDLVLSGHAHQDIEFRLETYYDVKHKKNEVGIYCWNYSDQLVSKTTPLTRKEWWEKNKPFVLQTAATGPFGKDEPEIRRIIIENNEIKEMTPIKLKSLD